jgi:hypothetical protein
MHALVGAIVLWVVAAGLLMLGTRYRDPFGQLKWNDFVHFYTLGDIARHGPVSALYDPEAQYRRQVALVPESAPERYLPAYPPQIALVAASAAAFPPLWSLCTGGFWADRIGGVPSTTGTKNPVNGSYRLPAWGLFWLCAGGIACIAGVGFRTASRLPYAHSVWHLFVLAGTGCDVVAVLGYAT